MKSNPAEPRRLRAPSDTADRHDEVPRVLSVRAIWWAAGLIVLVGVGVAMWLLLAYGRGSEQARNQIEAIKTAGTIVVGTGGAVALLLAARRQRTAEIALKQKERDQAHQERVASATESDAAARRITEQYTKAIEQLGSAQAPVRLGGLYALERLAQGDLEQRQTIVNVLCAYLRMPYHIPGAPPADDVDEKITIAYEQRVQEREVRVAAQRLFFDHLRPSPAAIFWPAIDLDLTGAVLINFSLAGCMVHHANFASAIFFGNANFNSATFTGHAYFTSATFTGRAYFGRVPITGHFESATFQIEPDFQDATFAGGVPDTVKRFLPRMTREGETTDHQSTSAP